MSEGALVSPPLVCMWFLTAAGRLRTVRARGRLFFQPVSSRSKRASLIVTSNKNIACSGEVFGDDTVAAAMRDRSVHHAEVIALKGDSYRLKNRGLGRVPAAVNEEN